MNSRYDEPDIPPERGDPPGSGWRGAVFAIGFMAWLGALAVAGRFLKDMTLVGWIAFGVPAIVIAGLTIYARVRRWRDRSN